MIHVQTRDRLGRFVKGNRAGITNSNQARELQLLSAQQRIKNWKSSLKRELILEQAEAEGLDQVTQCLAMLIFDALQGNIKAIRVLAQDLNLVECDNCYNKHWNPRRENRYQRIGRAARLVGLADEFELIEKLTYTLTTVAMGSHTRNGTNTVQAYRLILKIMDVFPCPRCKK